MHLRQMHGDKEKRARRIVNTLSKLRTQTTQQLPKRLVGAAGFVGRQGKPVRGQEGMASMVVVTILAVIITLISIGFARIMDRAINSSENRQASNAATYAAESGINDVAAYIKAYAQAHPNDPQPTSSNCTGSQSLLGTSFAQDSNLSGDSTTKYSCILLNETPTDVAYQAIPSNDSQVVKLTTSAYQYSLDKIMISWQPTSPAITGYPATAANSTNNLKDESTWNSTTNNFIPMLRVTLYPIPEGDSIANVQANSKTIFLYPQNSSGNVPVVSYGTVADGSFQPVNCTNTLTAGSFTGTADYKCNVIIKDLTLATTQPSSANTDYFYARLTPLYNTADVKIKANDEWSQKVKFVNVQAVVDVTAQSDAVAKRLQARLDISCLISQPCDNLIPTNYSAPEYTVRSTNAICKRLLEYSSYYSYAQEDGPSEICNQLNNEIYTAAPTLAFSITGNNGTDNSKRVCSAGDAPEQANWGCTTSNNPDSPQSPQQTGTVYINSGATVSWVSTDSAISCNATGNWSGDKNPQSTWGDPNVYTGKGSQDFPGISTYQTYNLQCKGPGGTTPTKTVHAWPNPTVSFSGSDSSYRAGNSYTIRWSSNSATSCTISSSGNKSWNATYSGLSPSGDSKSNSWGTSWDDNSTKTYHIVCVDPIGRSTSANWTVSTSGGGTTILPPSCSAHITPGTYNSPWSWSGGCSPSASPAWQLTNCSGSGIACGYQASSGSQLLGPGSYCNELSAYSSAWGTMADSGRVCWTVYPPLRITYFRAAIWDEGPNPCSAGANIPPYAVGKYYCRNNVYSATPFPCADGTHRWLACPNDPNGNDMQWSASGGDGNIRCNVGNGIYTGFNISGGSNYSISGSLGWGGNSPNGQGPNPDGSFHLHCSDGTGQTADASG